MIIPVATSKELSSNKPLKVFFEGSAVVLFRSNEGVSAFKDMCPHRGVPLSDGCVKQGVIICPYHNWKFNEGGALIDVPGDPNFRAGTSPILNKYFALENNGLIWLSENTFTVDETFSPEVHTTHEHATIVGRVRSDKVDVAENFLDALHTHSVHAGIIRSTKPKHKCTVTVRNVGNAYEATYVEGEQQTGILSKLFGGNVKKSVGRVREPGVLEIEYISDEGIEMSVVIYIAEEPNNICKLIMTTYLKKTKVPFFLKAMFLAPVQLIVFWQDKRILEKQSDSLLLNSEFSPIVRETDIMRPYIERVFQGEFTACDEQRELLL